ncbi:MAG: anti-sigma factor antagonist [Microthrixaceae bacterium]|nr:anti-sigma factor antagonist [Microthrixaceae bacterium]
MTGTWGSGALEIDIKHTDGVTVCQPVGDLDAYTVPDFRERLTEAASLGNVIIDLSEVPFMDSAGLGALAGGIRRTRDAGGEIVVSCNRATLVRLLQTTGFDKIVSVVDTVDEARLSLQPNGDA